MAAPQEQTPEPVVRATLENGLRLVIVRDPLAPVVTIEENYLAGGNVWADQAKADSSAPGDPPAVSQGGRFHAR